MANSFYWYDLETSGTAPRWDRIVQFAGLRTDEALNVIGDEYCTYVRLPDDVLPNPDASLVTGITPQLTHAKGVSETQALLTINEIFSEPGTCVAGYNSLRFDDEFTRFGLYRNLLDPYAREWKNGNSRWDLIDLVRATGALRREGINWPQEESGLPVYKLEELTKANGIDHGHAHDAMSDVHATVGLARLIKEQQPRLFDYYFSLRHKKQVRQLLEPYGAQMCVHVSGMYPRQRYGVAPIVSVARHPTNSNSIVVADLAEDITPLLEEPAEQLAEKLFTKGAENRPPLKEIRINRCPFVAPIEVLNEENQQRLEIDLALARERAQLLKAPGVGQKITQIYQQPRPSAAEDVDAGLYDGFLQDADRNRCENLHLQLQQRRWQDLDYDDKRLHTLAARMKARSFPGLMDAEDLPGWQEFVTGKLTTSGDWLNLAGFDERIKELTEALLADPDAAQTEVGVQQLGVLQQLAEYGVDLRHRYLLD